MTLTLLTFVVLSCSGAPEPYPVRYAAGWGLHPAALIEHAETDGLQLVIPYEVQPGEILYVAYYSIDAAGNTSKECEVE